MSGWRWQHARGVWRARLMRADKRNALTRAMWTELSEWLHELPGTARLVVIEAEGEHFSAGADIAELREHLQDRAWMLANHAQVQAAQRLLASLPCPTLAVIRGCCFGGGLGLASACDLRIAAEDARFAITPVKLGLQYSMADTRRLLRMVGWAQAHAMLYTGAEVGALQAHAQGWVQRLASSDALEQAAEALIESLRAAPPATLRGLKATLAAIAAGAGDDDAAAEQRFADAFAAPEFQEAAAAFLERRPPRFDGTDS